MEDFLICIGLTYTLVADNQRICFRQSFFPFSTVCFELY